MKWIDEFGFFGKIEECFGKRRCDYILHHCHASSPRDGLTLFIFIDTCVYWLRWMMIWF
jgi:hypothetical protein